VTCYDIFNALVSLFQMLGYDVDAFDTADD